MDVTATAPTTAAKYGPLADVIEGRLLGLGDTAGDVAESLRRAGVRGERTHPMMCPLAEFLSRIPGTDNALIGAGRAFVDGKDGRTSYARTPPACRQFIRLFDAGGFPDLVS